MPDTVLTNMEAPQQMAAAYQRRSTEFDKLAAALAKAQGAMEHAKKESENPAFKRGDKISKYADLASVWDAIRKPLADNGLSVMQWPRTVDKGVEIETELLHESGQFMRDTLWLPCPTMTVHTVGSTITYGRRYALMSVVGISPEDDDGNAAAEAHKAGAPGSAGAGTNFRPPGRRQQSSWGEGGKQGAIEEAQRDGLTANAKPKPLPGAPAGRPVEPINTPAAAGNAIKRIAWCREAAEFIKGAATKDELQTWWKDNAERLGVIETAMPGEHENLLVAFDEAIERAAVRAA